MSYASPNPITPPGDQIPGIVSFRSVIASARDAKIALIEVRCFRSGYLFEIHCVSRYLHSPTTEETFFAEDSLVMQPQSEVAVDSDPHVLRLAASTSDNAFYADLRVIGGSATRDHELQLRYLTQQYWADAENLPEEAKLLVNWPAYEVDDQKFAIDGASLRTERLSAEAFRL